MGARGNGRNRRQQTHLFTALLGTKARFGLRCRNKIAGYAGQTVWHAPRFPCERQDQLTRVQVVVRQTTSATQPDRSRVFFALTVTVPE